MTASPPAEEPSHLEIANLTVDYRTKGRPIRAVSDVSLRVRSGEALGVVGESGSGKSTLVMASVGLLDPTRCRVSATRVMLGGHNLLSHSHEVLGRRIGVVFQNPAVALNPLLTIERQLTDHMRCHLHLGQQQCRAHAVELLREVGIPDAARRLGSYPNEFSGGMLQRVTIAMALACDPELLVADEPTTALDVTIQAEIIELMSSIRRRRRLTLIWVTHDLGLLSQVADRTAVMYAGRIVEVGRTNDVYARPEHPYTKALLDCAASLWTEGHGALTYIKGQPPDLATPSSHCAFRPRCSRAVAACAERPQLRTYHPDGEHEVACFNRVVAA